MLACTASKGGSLASMSSAVTIAASACIRTGKDHAKVVSALAQAPQVLPGPEAKEVLMGALTG